MNAQLRECGGFAIGQATSHQHVRKEVFNESSRGNDDRPGMLSDHR
jgi:hypothetical protein